MGAGGVPCIAKQANQTLSVVLRVVEDQQPDGFFIVGHGLPGSAGCLTAQPVDISEH